MKERTIMIFPKFDNIELIDRIRIDYDPLAHLVQPHITLVFPFESDLTDEMVYQQLDIVLRSLKPFRLVCHGVEEGSSRFGHYLFLQVCDGKEKLIWRKLIFDYPTLQSALKQ